jgi:hypothetical protein
MPKCSGRELPEHGGERTLLCVRYGELFNGENHEEALHQALGEARLARWLYQARCLGTPEDQEKWIRDDPTLG